MAKKQIPTDGSTPKSENNVNSKPKDGIAKMALAMGLTAVVSIGGTVGVMKSLDSKDAPTAATSTSSATSTPSVSISDGNTKQKMVEYITKTGLIPGTDFQAPIDSPQAPPLMKKLTSETEAIEGMTIGKADAPVTLTLIEDFSCPICTKFETEVFPELKPLIDNGTLKVVWHNFVIFPNYGSNLAAKGSIAAAKQGKLFDYIKAAYDSAGEGNHPNYTQDTVFNLAKSVGLDMNQFAKDYDSQETEDLVNSQTKAASDMGLNGTPTFFFNSSIYMNGLRDANFIKNTIEFVKATGLD